MLQVIRDKAQGWIAWVIVLLISVPFALWGIQEYLGVGSDPVVADVDGVEITQQQLDRNVDRYRSALRERLGASYDPEMFSDETVRRQVLDGMVRDIVLATTAQRLGLRAGDDMVRGRILAIPAFQSGGQFDTKAYESALRLQGYSPATFEQRLRDDLATALLENGIRNGALVTDLEIDDYVKLRDQKRDLAVVTIDTDTYASDIAPGDDEIKAYFDANANRFMRPERVKVNYLELSRDQIAANLQPSEEALETYYRDHVEEFTAPEQRRLSHILITPEGEGDEADAKARATAEELRDRLNQGEDFAQLAQTYSKDPGSATQGGDLGFVARGVMVPAFEDAAFALEQGVISEPVHTQFGYHLIRVDEIQAGGTQPFEAARDRVDRAYRQAEAEQAYYNQAEQLTDITYERHQSLEPAAEALGLEIKTSDWITRSGGEGVLASPKVAEAAFSDDVLQAGNNSEPVELDPTHVIVLRTVEHEEAMPKALDEVHDQIVAILRADGAATKAEEAATGLLAKVKEGMALESAAAEQGLTVETHAGVARSARELSPAVVNAAFAAGRPGEGRVAAGSVALQGGDQSVFVVQSVADGDPAKLSAAERDGVRAELTARRAERDFDLFVEQQIAEAGVDVVPQRQ